jgi:DNA-binding transcriptional LysR family regulator
MDRLASITAFVRVAESGGFTAAARRLDLSTTTVSDQCRHWRMRSACVC